MKLSKRVCTLILALAMSVSVFTMNVGASIDDGLIAGYSFESEGKAEDISGNGNDGIAHNVVWEDGSYRFTRGEGSYIDIGGNIVSLLEGAQAVTLSAWIKVDGSPNNAFYIFHIPLDGGKVGLEMFINPTSFRLAGRSNPQDAWLNKKYPYPEIGRWNHVVGIFDFKSKEIVCYINGVEQIHDGGSASAAFGSDKFVAGSNYSNASISNKTNQSEFNGHLDELRIYNRRLSMDEIGALGSAKALDTSLTSKEITEIAQGKLSGAAVLALNCSDAFVNKRRVKIDKENYNLTPVLENGRTLVPVRFISEAFGFDVSYDEASSKATISNGKDTVTIVVGENVLHKNGNLQALDLPAQVIESRIFLPLRAVSEALGKSVLYYDELIVISDENVFNIDGVDDKAVLSEMKKRLTQLNYIPPVRDHMSSERIVAYSDVSTGLYIASPCVIRLSNGDLLAAHDYNGPKNNMTQTIYRSSDDGETWTKISQVHPATWATLFEHNGSVYLFGTSAVFGSVVIYKSDDFGETWTEAKDSKTGLLLEGGADRTPPNYHTAPVPVVKHNGRIYRAFEDAATGTSVSQYEAFIMSAPEDANLLDASSWTVTNKVKFDPNKIPDEWGVIKTSSGWLEGNVVVTPEGEIWNILRTTTPAVSDKAAILKLSADNKTLIQDPNDVFIHMPGASHKFTIRYDEVSKKYVSIVNENSDVNSYNQRNILSLAYSDDLKNWNIAETLIADDDILSWEESIVNIGYQYVDFFIEGDDILMLVRQATDGAANYHDANHITFYRIKDFRMNIK